MPPTRNWALDLAVYVFSLAVLLAAVAVLGMAFDGDGFCYLIWGRELATGQHMNITNPSYTAPKILPILIAAVGHWLPGARGAEHLYIFATAAAGAAVVLLTSRLARRVGGVVAGLVVVPLILGHMQFLRYVTNGQSTVFASMFLLGALLLATREAAGVGHYLWASALMFGAALCRPETSAIGGALALALYLRLGWRRPWWPLMLLLVGIAAAGANVLFYKVGFGSFTYTSDLAREDTVLQKIMVPGLTAGFVTRVVKTVVHYANSSWVLLLLAGLGTGLVLSRRQWRRYAAVFLFPVATASFTWLLLTRGVLFNERCYYYVTFVVVALASAAVGRLAAWAGSSTGEEFLTVLPPRWRSVGLVALVLGFLAPPYLSRPLPTDQGKRYRQVEKACAFLAPKLAGRPKPPRLLVSDEMGHAFFRLGLSPDESCVHLRRARRAEGGKLPRDIEWAMMDELTKPGELPASWGMGLVWQDKTGRVRIYHREGAHKGGGS